MLSHFIASYHHGLRFYIHNSGNLPKNWTHWLPMTNVKIGREEKEEKKQHWWRAVGILCCVPPGRNFDTRVSVINCPSIERRRHLHELVYILVSVRPEGRISSLGSRVADDLSKRRERRVGSNRRLSQLRENLKAASHHLPPPRPSLFTGGKFKKSINRPCRFCCRSNGNKRGYGVKL